MPKMVVSAQELMRSLFPQTSSEASVPSDESSVVSWTDSSSDAPWVFSSSDKSFSKVALRESFSKGGALFGCSSKEACLLGEGEFNDDSRATLGENWGGSVSKGVLPFDLLKEFNTSKDISPFSPVAPPFPFPFLFLVMTWGNRNTTHTRVLAGQSVGGVTSFMKHGIPCCWLVIKLGTPQDKRLDRSALCAQTLQIVP
jgi:hypothetical protein